MQLLSKTAACFRRNQVFMRLISAGAPISYSLLGQISRTSGACTAKHPAAGCLFVAAPYHTCDLFKQVALFARLAWFCFAVAPTSLVFILVLEKAVL